MLLRPAEHAEALLIQRILTAQYPAGSLLPAERELAADLGVTRPTLREALQRLSRDGWLLIRQGKATQVCDIWRDGGLNILGSLVAYPQHLPPDFITHLLQVRLDFAPSYAAAAVKNAPTQISAMLAQSAALDATPEAYAAFDWQVHRTLTIASGNPIYTLILNGFTGFYQAMAQRYFTQNVAREASQQFYSALHDAAQAHDSAAAAAVTRHAIAASIDLWRDVEQQQDKSKQTHH